MTSTWPGACWFDGGSWRRSHSSCWGWQWLAWALWRTSLSGISDRALTRGWSWWLLTIFARWWVSYSPILTQYTASSSRNTQSSQLDLVEHRHFPSRGNLLFHYFPHKSWPLSISCLNDDPLQWLIQISNQLLYSCVLESGQVLHCLQCFRCDEHISKRMNHVF